MLDAESMSVMLWLLPPPTHTHAHTHIHIQTYYHITPMRWVLMGVIGAVTGIIAFLVDISVKYLLQLKYSLLEQGT